MIIKTTYYNCLNKIVEFYLFGIILRQSGNPAGRTARIKKRLRKIFFSNRAAIISAGGGLSNEWTLRSLEKAGHG